MAKKKTPKDNPTKDNSPSREAVIDPKDISFDELAEMAAEAGDIYIDEPASDLVNKSPKEPAADDPAKEPATKDLTEYSTGEPVGDPVEEPQENEPPIDRQAAFEELYTEEERREITERIVKQFTTLFDTGTYSKLKDAIEKTSAYFKAIFSEETKEALQRLGETFKPVIDLNNELKELEPYIDEELKKPEYNGATLQDLLNEYNIFELANLPADSTLNKVLEAARAARAAALPIIAPFRTDELNTPVDKTNFVIWDDYTATNDQLKMIINMMSEADKRDPARKDLDITMTYSLTFDDDPNVRITKKLDHYDKRIAQAVDTLFTNGQPVFLTGDLWHAMGNTSANPSKNQREKMYKSLTKQGTARIYMNNAREAKHYDYPHFEYDGNVLSFERIRVTMENGQEAEAIHVLKRPPTMALADGRNQMTKIPIEVIQSGISQTDGNLRIESYLIQRIARQKNSINELNEAQKKKYTQERQKKLNSLRKLKILLSTFHEGIGKAKAKSIQRSRAETTAERYLTHYANCGWIESYKKTATAFEITLPKK